jgi:hypothetical protein
VSLSYFDAPGFQEARVTSGSAALAAPAPVRFTTTPSDQTRRIVLSAATVFSGTLYGYGKTPLSGITISASGSASAKTTTAADGSFALPLPPGTYTLEVTGERPSGVTATAAPRRFSFKTDPFALSESSSVDLTLPLHALSVTANGPEGPVEELPIVANGDGALAPGQMLTPGVEVASASISDWAYTNTRGTATVSLPDFAEGAASVGVVSNQTWKEDQVPATGLSQDSSRTLSLTSAAPKGYTFSGRVQTSDGVPVPAVLTLEKGEYGKPGFVEVQSSVYADGRFSLEVPTAGTYQLYMSLLFNSPGVPQGLEMWNTGISISGNMEQTLTVPVATVKKTLWYGRSPVLTSDLEGRSRGCEAGTDTGSVFWSYGIGSTGTDAAGQVELLGIANSICELSFAATAGSDNDLYGEFQQHFGTGDENQEEQYGGEEVTGTVADATGTPLPNASVSFSHRLTDGWAEVEAQADAGGSYTVLLPDGESEFSVSSGPSLSSSSSASFDFEGRLSVTGAMTQNVTMPTHAVTMHVVDADGSPQPDVGVTETPTQCCVSPWGTLAKPVSEAPGLTFARRAYDVSNAVTDASGNATLEVPDLTEPQELWLTPSESLGVRPVELSLSDVAGDETELVALGPSDHAPPSVAGVTVAGDTEAVTRIAIAGEHLRETTAVHCGEQQATSVTVQSASTILADCPNSSGTVDVTVSTPAGTSAITPADRFTYPAIPVPPTLKCANPDTAWHAENTTVACTATDAFPGLAHPEEASFTLSTSIGVGTETAEAFTGTRTVCDTEGRCAEAGPIGPFKIDRKPPSITIKQPADGLLVLQDSSMAAEYSCADGGSGIASCTGSTPNGQPVETSTLGEHTLAVQATDNARNQTSKTAHYTVVAGGECESALCVTGAGGPPGGIAPPTILGISASRSSVNTSTGPQAVNFTVHAADELAGVAALQVTLAGAGHTYTGMATLEAGTRLSGTWVASVTLPQGSPEGTYLPSVALVDEAGNSRTYNSVELQALGQGPITQTGPETPPQPPPSITGVSVSPPSVATCTEAQTATVTVSASDTPAGISTMRVLLAGPDSQDVSAYATLQSGSAQSGIWAAALKLPAYSAQGEWAISVQAYDRVGYETFLMPSQLQSDGYPHAIQQTCAGDNTPPRITALTVDPSSIDTSAAAQTVAVEAHATDDLSGVASVTATLSSGSQTVSAPARLQNGGDLSGNWLADLTLPQYSRQGTWQLSLRAADNIGNTITISSAQLAEMGLPATISQTGIADETPPAVTGGTVLPTRIDTENGPEQVQVRIQARDAQSGTARLWVEFTSIHGQQVSGWATLEEGGTPQEGTWRANLTFPRYSDEGGWELRVEAWDAFGNHVAYGPSELDSIVPTLHDGPPEPPVVSAVGPIYGREEGGSTVTIEGVNLEEAVAVKFGTANAKSFEQTSPDSITAVAPAGTGTVDVRVVTEGGKSPVATADHFTYIPHLPPPAIKKLSPNKGPAAGGTTVTITGAEYDGVTGVMFGSVPATSFKVNSLTSMTAVAPPDVSETVAVSVTTPNGASAATSKDEFKTEGPTVTSVTPNTGPKAGGSQVSITGTGFAPGARTIFLFGKTHATAVDCSSTTTCTATTPASSKTGVVDVIAEVGKAKSKKSTADHYTYG